METSNNMKAKLESLKNWFIRYSKIVLPIILVLCVALTIVIAIQANKRKVEQEESAVASDGGNTEDGVLQDVPQVPMEEASPEITELFSTYYTAMVEGDTETMTQMVYYMDTTEILRAAETSKYIESYPPLEIYTKAGPREGTYIVYVYADLKFYEYDQPVPGMRTYYVCTDEDGELYINEDGEESESELHYMREIQLQEDVVDLNNKAAAAYNDMIAEDKTLADFLVNLADEIEKNVGETLARAEESEATEENEEPDEAESEEANAAEVVVTKVKTTDVVNIRTSDSETADKLGKAAVGDEFRLLETKGNGWSKIEYDGKEAYIKSDFLEPSETETASADNEEDTSSQQADNEQTTTTTGTVTVKETVRIRAGASETSEKISTAYEGDKLEVIMKQADGWTKIKYNGKTAYVKSDYVE
ncbi:MAG: SH3 domain-containing protein [Lachnospiraceae bacterium]|nr:SH3 domain-containing protein [Lachnospiraceae bacterium]